MKKIKIIYWIVTGLFLFVMVGSAIPDVLVMDMAVQGFKEMQMPAYLLPFVGVAKLLGTIAILVPGYPRIKEWAYAGLIFDLIGAIYSVAASGKSVENWAPMLLFVALGFASYYYYHKLQKAKELNTLNANLSHNIASSTLQTTL
ncbi:DoxX family protein [Mucilaginibacter aquatilis]|uniref:DoxX family protein n=1 Tax=Mucilaginibacter aquatilis TaxID=1517760 RepID=A0A6I4IG57_9SPHI|nr:DoxX family protein [Mucilaginibacter aquatilis]MVN92618.1 DoxX family protein [Mucilaginibacter aquatilis]